MDTELLPDSIEDISYRVESSKESHFTVSDSSSITVSRAVSPKPENRLKVNSEYYVASGSIKYLNYGDMQSLNTSASTTTINSGEIFTGKTDSFNGDERILLGNGTDFIDFTSKNQNGLMDCRIGAHEYWNLVGTSALVYPVVKPWEVEPNREYTVVGGTNDSIEYDGKIYKNGDTFKGKQLTFNEPLSTDTSMFTDQLTSANLKEFSARGMKPWMDDSSFRPRERGFIELTPLPITVQNCYW